MNRMERAQQQQHEDPNNKNSICVKVKSPRYKGTGRCCSTMVSKLSAQAFSVVCPCLCRLPFGGGRQYQSAQIYSRQHCRLRTRQVKHLGTRKTFGKFSRILGVVFPCFVCHSHSFHNDKRSPVKRPTNQRFVCFSLRIFACP